MPWIAVFIIPQNIWPWHRAFKKKDRVINEIVYLFDHVDHLPMMWKSLSQLEAAVGDANPSIRFRLRGEFNREVFATSFNNFKKLWGSGTHTVSTPTPSLSAPKKYIEVETQKKGKIFSGRDVPHLGISAVDMIMIQMLKTVRKENGDVNLKKFLKKKRLRDVRVYGVDRLTATDITTLKPILDNDQTWIKFYDYDRRKDKDKQTIIDQLFPQADTERLQMFLNGKESSRQFLALGKRKKHSNTPGLYRPAYEGLFDDFDKMLGAFLSGQTPFFQVQDKADSVVTYTTAAKLFPHQYVSAKTLAENPDVYKDVKSQIKTVDIAGVEKALQQSGLLLSQAKISALIEKMKKLPDQARLNDGNSTRSMGSIVIMESGKTYASANEHALHYASSMCAERSNTSKLMAHDPSERIAAIFMSMKDKKGDLALSESMAIPCGHCAEALNNFVADNTNVVFVGRNDSLSAINFYDLFPSLPRHSKVDKTPSDTGYLQTRFLQEPKTDDVIQTYLNELADNSIVHSHRFGPQAVIAKTDNGHWFTACSRESADDFSVDRDAATSLRASMNDKHKIEALYIKGDPRKMDIQSLLVHATKGTKVKFLNDQNEFVTNKLEKLWPFANQSLSEFGVMVGVYNNASSKPFDVEKNIDFGDKNVMIPTEKPSNNTRQHFRRNR